MSRTFFQALESSEAGSLFALEPMLSQLSFDGNGLIPVITQCAESGEVLMMAWMNAQALRQTLGSGWMTYWSRSRACFWVKGESSGHRQRLVEMKFDCDGDALLCLVEQTGPACHTGRRHCFYYSVDREENQVRVTSSVPAAV